MHVSLIRSIAARQRQLSNSPIAGLTKSVVSCRFKAFRKMQRARLILDLRMNEHVAPALRQLQDVTRSAFLHCMDRSPGTNISPLMPTLLDITDRMEFRKFLTLIYSATCLPLFHSVLYERLDILCIRRALKCFQCYY